MRKMILMTSPCILMQRWKGERAIFSWTVILVPISILSTQNGKKSTAATGYPSCLCTLWATIQSRQNSFLSACKLYSQSKGVASCRCASHAAKQGRSVLSVCKPCSQARALVLWADHTGDEEGSGELEGADVSGSDGQRPVTSGIDCSHSKRL